MTNWKLDGGPVAIGIDIGWSKPKKSCALAVVGLTLPENTKGWKAYKGGRRPLAVGLYRYDELLPTICEMLSSLDSHKSPITVVLDGPVGPKGRPMANRYVDGAFTRGEFNGRMQPSPVATGDGLRYTEVTEEIVQVICAATGVGSRPELWNGQATTRLTICETHPTVGLALLLPKQDRSTLPSRKSPKRMLVKTAVSTAEESKFCRAKSDWYWQLGAGRWIAEHALHCPEVAKEGNHERVAGLYCLAVASLLATNPEKIMAVGKEDGVYVIPALIDRTWLNDIRNSVGIKVGTPISQDQSKYAVSLSDELVVAANSPGTSPVTPDNQDQSEEAEGDEVEKGDEAVLILVDQVGVWVQHNDWLEGMESPVGIKLQDGTGEIVFLEVGDRTDRALWTSLDKAQQTPLKLARNRGYPKAMTLTKKSAFSVPITILNSGSDCILILEKR